MRIIAGEHRGRRLLAPPGLSTRPMLDRVREALFSTLGERVERARVLDLFSGSGSLGLESLSRGATAVRMVERDPRALAVLKQNAEALNVGERARIIRGDALKPRCWEDEGGEAAPAPYQIVFLDPPYAMLDDPNSRAVLVTALDLLLAERMATGGVLVLHAPARALELLRFRFKEPSDLRVYGGSALLYLERRSTSVAEPP
jgi:16S rRNA (guanine966-N2)-methyltransferase